MYSDDAHAICKFVDTRRDVNVDLLEEATVANLVNDGKEGGYIISLELGELVEGLVQRSEEKLENGIIYRGEILNLPTI
jgi:hypothetical protein